MNTLKHLRNLLLSRHEVAEKWKSENKRPIVGWSCTYTPEEIIYAANILPVRVLGSTKSTKLADAYLPTNMCSFVRSCFDSALRSDYEYLDGYVTSNSCDNRGKIYDFWKCHTKFSYMHFINTPHTNIGNAHAFFYEELVRFKKSLEKAFETSILDKSLKDTIKIYNDNRTLLRKIYDLRVESPPLISGVEALEIVLSSMVIPKKRHNELLEKLLSEVESHAASRCGGVRLLVSGSVMDTSELLEIIESVGGVVVADDLCTGSRYFWNLTNLNGDPLRAITERYLNKIPCPFMYHHKERFRHVKDMVKKYDVEGVIIFVTKFCDVHLFDTPLLMNELEELGLPVLRLEWDHSMSGIAQLKTRIEAFIEMLTGVE